MIVRVFPASSTSSFVQFCLLFLFLLSFFVDFCIFCAFLHHFEKWRTSLRTRLPFTRHQLKFDARRRSNIACIIYDVLSCHFSGCQRPALELQLTNLLIDMKIDGTSRALIQSYTLCHLFSNVHHEYVCNYVAVNVWARAWSVHVIPCFHSSFWLCFLVFKTSRNCMRFWVWPFTCGRHLRVLAGRNLNSKLF